MLDSREGRVLGERPRRMFDEEEWNWLEGVVTGDVRHLLIADTLPIFLPQAIHNLESWNDAVAAGAWTTRAQGASASGSGARSTSSTGPPSRTRSSRSSS